MTEEERDNAIETLFRNKLEENEMEAGSELAGRGFGVGRDHLGLVECPMVRAA